MKLRITLALICFAFLCSCSSPKKLIYLQDDTADNVNAAQLIKTLKLQESEYKLRPKDRLNMTITSLTDEKVNFIKKPEMELVIDSNGQIELPVIGLIQIGGLTIKEAEDKIKKVSSDFLRSPSITIKVLNFSYTVIGEVSKQGSFVAEDPKVNILQAIGEAGGLTENANRENVRIVRSENGTAKIYKINLLEDNSLLSSNYFLQPNDIVLVDPIKANALRQERIATVGLVISIITSLSFLLYQVINR